uniref:Peptidase M12B domain-containing protein n=1 Tax=Junco hyemalis TaxID=40217 RepID=A0A8C5IMB3_JUNHY
MQSKNAQLIFIHRTFKTSNWSSREKFSGAEQYEIVYPQKLHAVHRRAAGTSSESKYDDIVKYGIKANGEEVVLQLQKNRDLLAGDYSETLYSADGRQITTTPRIKDHCYYGGHVEGDAESVASISTCTGLSGYFETRGQKFLIEPLGASDRDEHVVYKYEALKQEPIKTCGLVNNSWEQDSSDPIKAIFRSSNSPEMKAYLKSKKYVELYVVADNALYKKYDEDTKNVRQRIFGIVNYINTVYKAINTHVALVGLEVWTDGDKCPLTRNAGFTLEAFSKWRRSDLLKRKRNDNAQLITGLDFEGTTIGLAFMKSICSDAFSAAVLLNFHFKSKPANMNWDLIGMCEAAGLYSQTSPWGGKSQVWGQEPEVGDPWASGQAGKNTT